MRGRTDGPRTPPYLRCQLPLSEVECVGDWEAGMDAAPCDPRGTHSDLSLAAVPPSNILGSRRGRGSGNVIHHCPTRRKLVVAVVRSCITKGDHHAPLQRRLFSPPPPPSPSTPPPPPRVTKKRSVQSTSPLLRVAFPLLLATDLQIKEPTSLSALHVGKPRSYQSGGECQQCFSNSRNLLR